jgi:hypothetical protein
MKHFTSFQLQFAFALLLLLPVAVSAQNNSNGNLKPNPYPVLKSTGNPVSDKIAHEQAVKDWNEKELKRNQILKEVQKLSDHLILAMELNDDDFDRAQRGPDRFEKPLLAEIRKLKSIAENSRPVVEPRKYFLETKLDLSTVSEGLLIRFPQYAPFCNRRPT